MTYASRHCATMARLPAHPPGSGAWLWRGVKYRFVTDNHACGVNVGKQTMNPVYDFRGQVALVTGASSGMGLSTARAFAEAGAAVVLADINEKALRAATDELTSAGHQAIGVTCDVSDEAQVAAMVARAGASFGRLDMAFNNAGIQVPPSGAADEPAEQFDRVNAINLRGVWACMKHELR